MQLCPLPAGEGWVREKRQTGTDVSAFEVLNQVQDDGEGRSLGAVDMISAQ